jgi:hypothetical protein
MEHLQFHLLRPADDGGDKSKRKTGCSAGSREGMLELHGRVQVWILTALVLAVLIVLNWIFPSRD